MQQLMDAIAVVGSKYSEIVKIILFGSTARGDARENSDIDLAIFTKGENLREQTQFTEDILNLASLKKFDLVFVDNDTEPALLDNIYKEGKVIMDKLGTKKENFGLAIARLKEAIADFEASGGNKTMRDGVIQRFEFTTELAWKTTREYLLDQGYSGFNSPKATMREAFADGLIEDEALWLQILNDRNATSHLYSDEAAAKICERITMSYTDVFEKLYQKIA
ncbi:HI0074 family nucleotidyltransferase substrate-binding subunit [Eubacterium sp. 1001713B170207_170306_E7]|uniref:HI0074 family nucleotidyltransferase substrate-binding subunit n=1 Tax=Eubacterium sp. 1001713B170207_170306_E7 TaxID=2787097 RepID=UPI00189846E4|nr:HI0074 family nucleotidyltransferase substrate-binding subunit [Eubacterium sp. 1001713B170207_170306_E7]